MRLVLLTLLISSLPAAASDPIKIEGTIAAPMMAIGGETSGRVLKTDAGDTWELVGARAKDADGFVGKRVVATGTPAVINGVERGKRQSLEVETLVSARRRTFPLPPIDAELKDQIAKVQGALLVYQTKQTSTLSDNPLGKSDYGHYASASYLHFYRGIGFFLVAQHHPATDHKARIESLQKAEQSFADADRFSSSESAIPGLRAWVDKTLEGLYSASIAEARYSDALNYFARLPKARQQSNDLIVPYAKALLATEQTVILRQLFLNQTKVYTQALQHRLFASDRDALTKLAPAVTAQAKNPPKPEASAPAEAADHSLQARTKRSLKEITDTPFAAANLQRFNWISTQYVDLKFKFAEKEKEKASKEKPTREEQVFLRQVHHALAKIPPSLQYQIVTKLWRRGLVSDAIALLKPMPQRLGTDPLRPEAAYNLGRLYEDNRRYKEAALAYSQAMPQVRNTKWDDACAFRLGWMRYLGKKRWRPDMESYLKRFPEGDYASTATYMLMRESKDPAAIAEYVKANPMGYYSLVLREERDLSPDLILGTMPIKPDDAPEYTGEEIYRTSARNQGLVRVYRELKALGLRDEANSLLDQLSYVGDSAGFIYNVLREYGDLDALPGMTRFGIQVFNQNKDLRQWIGWNAIYPTFHDELIATLLKQHGLADYPFLVQALVRQESAFDVKAKSKADAMGAMQLIQSSAEDMAKLEKMPRFDLYDPNDNLRLGVAYLKTLMQRYDNQLHYVLAAYNAGPGAVDLWVQLRGHLPRDAFIESIPYQETRSYVKLVLRNYWLYNLLYKPSKK